jgi:hypothetical protein
MSQEDDAKFDHPWTEEEWLAEFRRNDVRSAKFGELLETFADDPDCEEKINQEMGWKKNDDIERPWVDEFEADAAEIARELDEELRLRGESEESEDEPGDDEFEEEAASTDETKDASDDEDDGAPARSWRRMRDDDDPDPDHGPLPKIPAYALGMDLAVDAVKAAKPFPEETWAKADQHELFCEAVGNTMIPAAKIAGGHSYGYDTNICANIVNNRIALEAVEKSLANFAELEAAGVLPPVFRDRIVPRVRELRQLIVDRIAAMRKRVWW